MPGRCRPAERRPVKVRVTYRMSDKWAREQLLATGEEHATMREVELDLAQLTPEDREIVLDARNAWGVVELATYSDGGHSANYTTAPDGHELNADAELGDAELIEAIRASAQSKQTARAVIQARQAAEYAREAAHEQAEADQIAAWVSEHGTANQQARMAAGLLPREEVLQEIEAAAYAALNEFPRYVPLAGKDVAHVAGCYGESVHFSSEAAKEATAEEWERMEAIRVAAPAGASIELRTHRGQCQQRGCDLDAYRSGIKVTITVGAFEFTREYAAR